MSGLPAGTYYLRALATEPAHAAELFGGLVCVPSCDVTTGTPVVVTDGVNTTGINFTLDAGGSIIGITHEAMLGRIPSGVALYSSDGVLVQTTTANASGNYTFAGLPAGTHYARTTNTLGYRDAEYDGHAFCDPVSVAGIVSQLVDGAFQYYRASPPPGTTNEAVILQDTGASAL